MLGISSFGDEYSYLYLHFSLVHWQCFCLLQAVGGYNNYYYYAPREHTGFWLLCKWSPDGAINVQLQDKSQSEKRLDKTHLVSVSIQMCSFTALGGYTVAVE
jgi:hypothetical protein